MKLGYGGTKEEMQRLLEDAEKLSGIEYDISSYADIVDAIHVVQTEMGITGTTAKEASTTIQGSLASMKSAWQNLLTGVADDNADFDTLVDNFVESVGTAANNIIPRIDTALQGVGKLIEELVPVLIDKIPVLINSTLPSLIQSGVNLVASIASGMLSALPKMAESAVSLIQMAKNMIVDFAKSLTDPQNLSNVVDAAINIVVTLTNAIIDAIPSLIESAPEIIKNLVVALIENVPKIGEAALSLMKTLFDAIVKNIPIVLKSAGEIVGSLVGAFAKLLPKIVGIGVDIVKGVWQGIKSMASTFANNIKNFFSGIVDSVKSVLGIHSPSRVFAGIGENMALGLSDGWDSEYNKIKRNITNGLDFGTATIDAKATMSGKLQNALTNIGNIGGDINIVVQSVLDGKIIGETAYKYNRQMQRAMGV